jgi:thiamine-phosphate pyrophosphorylase
VALSDQARLARPDALARIVALARAGCPAILLRPGGLETRPLLALARTALASCRDAGAELWIGERVDVALAIGADGVHLPARGLSTAGARRAAGASAAGGAMRVGRSVHSAAEAARAAREGADHVILGTIFPTPTHPDAAAGGPALIAAARAAVEAERAARGSDASIPILAVGGITPATLPAALDAGAWGGAALSALWDAPDPAAAVRAFLRALHSRG